jgi:hypothetical protein
VLTEETPEDIQTRLKLTVRLRRSLRQLSYESGVSLGYVCKATKFIHFRPHKVTAEHELRHTDPASVRLSNWMLQNVHDDFVDQQLLFITDEAYFYLSS